jgi:hypothetical protein
VSEALVAFCVFRGCSCSMAASVIGRFGPRLCMIAEPTVESSNLLAGERLRELPRIRKGCRRRTFVRSYCFVGTQTLQWGAKSLKPKRVFRAFYAFLSCNPTTLVTNYATTKATIRNQC